MTPHFKTIRDALEIFTIVGIKVECPKYADKALTALSQLQKEREELVEGLEFYANPQIYKSHPHGIAFDSRDLSFKAKALLKKLRGGE